MFNFPNSKPEVSLPSPECPAPQRWRCYDNDATEVEVLEFLHALVRMLKPSVIVETGTYLGYGTAYLASACVETGGTVHTAEVDTERSGKAATLAAERGLTNIVFHHCAGTQMIETLPTIDFAFLDSVFGGVRIDELRLVLPRLSRGGIIAIHDTSSYHAPFGGPRQGVLALAAELGLGLIMFDTPRGLALLRKADLF
jgi:hypothetical protein